MLRPDRDYVVKAGDTFRFTASTPGVDANRHLWIVLSDVTIYPNEVMVVFMTSFRPGMDQTCSLDKGDHPFVTHKTTIAYGAAAVWKSSALQTAFDCRKIVAGDPVDRVLLNRIRSLASYSPKFALRHQEIAAKQRFDEPLASTH